MGRKKLNIFNQTIAEAKVTTKEEINKEPIHIDLTPEVEPIEELIEEFVDESNIEEIEVDKVPVQDEVPVGNYENIDDGKQPVIVATPKLSIAQQRMKLRYGMKRQ